MSKSKPPPNAPCLAWRRKGAAKALNISERILAELTDSGAIPHVKLSRRLTIYPVSAIEAWLVREAARGGGQ